MLLTHERLLELLSYDAATGVLRWRVAPCKRIRAGSVAGFGSGSGHLRVKISRRTYAAHRLVWFHVHGQWPDGDIDHKNGNPSDNRLVNLRCVPPGVNAQNLVRPTCRNKTGFLGVSRDGDRFRATVSSNGRKVHAGLFETPDAAYAAYVETKRRLHAGCTL